MAHPAHVSDELPEQLYAKISDFRVRQQLLTTGDPEAAQSLCDQAISAVTKHAVGQFPQGNDAKQSNAIHSHWMDPIGAMLSEAFNELHLVCHELALEIARRRRATRCQPTSARKMQAGWS